MGLNYSILKLMAAAFTAANDKSAAADGKSVVVADIDLKFAPDVVLIDDIRFVAATEELLRWFVLQCPRSTAEQKILCADRQKWAEYLSGCAGFEWCRITSGGRPAAMQSTEYNLWHFFRLFYGWPIHRAADLSEHFSLPKWSCTFIHKQYPSKGENLHHIVVWVDKQTFGGILKFGTAFNNAGSPVRGVVSLGWRNINGEFEFEPDTPTEKMR